MSNIVFVFEMPVEYLFIITARSRAAPQDDRIGESIIIRVASQHERIAPTLGTRPEWDIIVCYIPSDGHDKCLHIHVIYHIYSSIIHVDIHHEVFETETSSKPS